MERVGGGEPSRTVARMGPSIPRRPCVRPERGPYVVDPSSVLDGVHPGSPAAPTGPRRDETQLATWLGLAVGLSAAAVYSTTTFFPFDPDGATTVGWYVHHPGILQIFRR